MVMINEGLGTLSAQLKKFKDRIEHIDNILCEKDDANMERELKDLRQQQRDHRKKIKAHEEKKQEYMTLAKRIKDLTIEINVKQEVADNLDAKLAERDDSDLEDEL